MTAKKVTAFEKEKAELTGKVAALETEKAALIGKVAALETEKAALIEKVAGYHRLFEEIREVSGLSSAAHPPTITNVACALIRLAQQVRASVSELPEKIPKVTAAAGSPAKKPE